MSKKHPMVKWAQRSDKLSITVDLPDAEQVKLKLEPHGNFFFSATVGAHKTPYEVDLDLFDRVDVNESKARVGSRNITMMVKKSDEKWWSRLTRQPGKPPVFLGVDWDKWVDEDDDHTSRWNDTVSSNFDLSNLNMADEDAVDVEDVEGKEEEEEPLEDREPSHSGCRQSQ